MSAKSTTGGASTAGGCPVCGKQTAERWRPFCSKRCADVDLGRWLKGSYAIPGEPAETDDEGGTGGRPALAGDAGHD